jgi:hypothetical protein
LLDADSGARLRAAPTGVSRQGKILNLHGDDGADARSLPGPAWFGAR